MGLGINPKAFILVNDYPTLAIAADAIAAIALNDTRLAEMRAEPVSMYPELYERLNWRANNASAYVRSCSAGCLVPSVQVRPGMPCHAADLLCGSSRYLAIRQVRPGN